MERTRNIWIGVILVSYMVMTATCIGPEKQPRFDAAKANVTVKEGETAILPCEVINRGEHNVVWMDPHTTVLSHDDRRIIDDDRISVERDNIKQWFLHIREVTFEDSGDYNCQVNTNPVKIKIVSLYVKVPPKILADNFTDSVVTPEGTTVTLECRATGIPLPKINWTRTYTYGDQTKQKSTETLCGNHSAQIGSNSDVLIIRNITRNCSDTYHCIAYNQVGTAVSRAIKVDVQFPPSISIGASVLRQRVDRQTILTCVMTGNPQTRAEWLKDGEKVKKKPGEYRLEFYNMGRYQYALSLDIHLVKEHHFGNYTCEASNGLGTEAKSVLLQDLEKHQSQVLLSETTSTIATPPPRRSQHPQRHQHQHQHQNQNQKHGRGSNGHHQQHVHHRGYGNRNRNKNAKGDRLTFMPNEYPDKTAATGTGRSKERNPTNGSSRNTVLDSMCLSYIMSCLAVVTLYRSLNMMIPCINS